MLILTATELEEWVRLDADAEDFTLNLLEASAIDFVGHETGLNLREMDVDEIPHSLRHAIAVFIAAHYDNRDGNVQAADRALRALCAPHRVPRL